MTGARIWVDPSRCGGSPAIYGTRLATANVAGLVWDAGVDTARACWPHVSEADLLAACWYEAEHGNRRHWKKRFGDRFPTADEARNRYFAARKQERSDRPIADDHDFDASDGKRPLIYRRNRIVATACTQCRLSSNACQAGQATRDGRPCCDECNH